MHAKHVTQLIFNYLIFLIIMCEGSVLQGVYFSSGELYRTGSLFPPGIERRFFHRGSTDSSKFLADAGFQCHKASVLWDTIKWTPV